MARQTVEAAGSALLQLLDSLAPAAGDRLPPERELAQMLSCSRDTLRKALARLEAQGEIWRHVGQGTFRGSRPRHLPLRDTVLIDGVTPLDLMRARLLVEPQIAAEAARRADAADADYLRRKAAAGRSARDTLACEQVDDAFHRAVAQVSANPVLIGFLGFLSGTRRRTAWQREWDRTYRRIGVGEFRSLHSDQHHAVAEAIARGDPEEAYAAMTRHLGTIEAALRRGPPV
ncbi:FCD domain-containing protein [Leisingera daeponensis]|uniref:FCD domain-containing protein n=1 Tax=Leisingera daeponensis TaxID=405746 RepID=A0ABS7NHJ4_9RHOB|nr:FCD domain-containing protein [Leisingera daeponensis]MBY6059268.1 FCD domain-containing protein [Leisingera daeponensis]MBY6140351.1 FCD domain-containing protein [Leisingera daeponensis]